MTTALTIIGIITAIYCTRQGILHLREHNQFMRELDAKQRLRREKAEKLKGLNL